MTITVQVVGVFFKAELTELDADTQVLDVLNETKRAVANGLVPNVLDFGFRDDGRSLVSFQATYKESFTGRVTKHVYDPGQYFLTEDTTTKPAYTVWQYYIVNPDGTNLSGGVRFLNDPTAMVPNGGKLIWRLVSILAEPSAVPKAISSSLSAKS